MEIIYSPSFSCSPCCPPFQVNCFSNFVCFPFSVNQPILCVYVCICSCSLFVQSLVSHISLFHSFVPTGNIWSGITKRLAHSRCLTESSCWTGVAAGPQRFTDEARCCQQPSSPPGKRPVPQTWFSVSHHSLRCKLGKHFPAVTLYYSRHLSLPVSHVQLQVRCQPPCFLGASLSSIVGEGSLQNSRTQRGPGSGGMMGVSPRHLQGLMLWPRAVEVKRVSSLHRVKDRLMTSGPPPITSVY